MASGPTFPRSRALEDDASEPVFTPLQILPGQYADARRPRREPCGPRRLMLAVLEEAMATYGKHRNARDRVGGSRFAEAQAWFDSTDTRSLFAFEHICDTLGIDADYVRRGLRTRHPRLAEAA